MKNSADHQNRESLSSGDWIKFHSNKSSSCQDISEKQNCQLYSSAWGKVRRVWKLWMYKTLGITRASPSQSNLSSISEKHSCQPIRSWMSVHYLMAIICLSGPTWWSDFTKLSINKYVVKHKLDWKWDRTQCSLNFFVPTAPAPVLNTRLLSPPRREVPSTPAKRRQGRRQCRDTTPLTPTSTRTLNCRASSQQLCQPSASWTHMYTCTAEAVYLHTYHSIMSCTIIELLTLNWLLLL